MKKFKVFQGSRLHWLWSVIDYYHKLSDYTKEDSVIIWGFDENNKGRWKNIRDGEIVFFKVNKDGKKDSGVFGMGKIVEKFEKREKYWPSEYEGGRYYPYRVKISQIIINSKIEELAKNLNLEIIELYKSDINKFFKYLHGYDIFEGNLIEISTKRGSIITIDENEAKEIENFLKSSYKKYPEYNENKKNIIREGRRFKDFVDFISHIYESEINISMRELERGKNIIFYGPPGSGKTLISKIIAKKYSLNNKGNGYVLYTVHSGTDYFDLVSRIIPTVKNGSLIYEKEVRPLLDCILNKKVLILDEINRTQIDTALGIFFTYLEKEHRMQDLEIIQKIIHSETNTDISEEELKDKLEFFRIIGTLNSYDKTFLFKLGDALRRRFVFVEITTDEKIIKNIKNEFNEFLKIINYKEDRSLAEKILEIFEKINDIKELGIGIFKDLLLFSQNFDAEEDIIEKSIMHIILPFFENDINYIKLREIFEEYGLESAIKKLEKLNYVTESFEEI